MARTREARIFLAAVEEHFGSADPGQAVLLARCGWLLDRLRACERAISRDGLTAVGSTGQPRANPLIAVHQVDMALLLKMLDALFPDDAASLTPAQARGRHAAAIRHLRGAS